MTNAIDSSNKNLKKISINDIMKGNASEDNEVLDIKTYKLPNGAVLEYQTMLALDEMLDFVSMVVDSCVDASTGEYTPEVFDFAIREAVLTHYANVEMPSGLKDRYAFLYSTNLFDIVMESVNMRQFNDIIRAINKKLEYVLGVITSSAASKIYEILESVGNFTKAINETFEEISPEDMNNVLKNISKLEDAPIEDIAASLISKKDK